MSQKIETYVDRLRKFYADDAVSLARIEKDVKSVEYAREMAEFRKSPHAERLFKSAVDRFKTAHKRLSQQREMAQDERDLVFLDMDWARWYIASVGGNPEEVEQTLERDLKTELKRLGL